jgi:hypothetical protein
VENKLTAIKKQRERTDYLLSLSLPKAVWTKMREFGMSKRDNMSKRINSGKNE